MKRLLHFFVRVRAARCNTLIGILLFLVTQPALFAQVQDVTPPQLVSFGFSPATIDTRNSSQTVTATARITDDLSGLSFCEVDFSSPSGRQTQFLFFRTPPVTGTTLDGTYSGTLQFPQFTESGIWVVRDVNCFDKTGNQNLMTTSQLQALGFPTELSVVSTQDTLPPQISSFGLSPSTIDVSNGSQTVTIAVGATDDLSGVDFTLRGGSGASIVMQSPTGKQTQVIGNDKFALVSGTSRNGIWQAGLSIPQYSEVGTWSLQRLLLEDAVGNFTFLGAADLQARGLSSNLLVSSSPSDISPPQLTGLSVSPAFIDTSKGSQTVTVTIGARDDLAGVSFSPSYPFTTCISATSDPTNLFKRVGLLLISPSGTQTRCLEPGSGAINRIAGTPQDGTWQGTVFFPQFSEAGTWKASLILKDAAENFATFDTSTLQGLGAQTDLVVTSSTACTFSLSPTAQSFTAQGGLGSFVVNTGAACAWSATSSASWITLLPGSSCTKTGDVMACPAGAGKVNFAVAANGPVGRAGTISVGDQHFNIDQQGLACNSNTFAVSPARVTVGAGGGSVRIVVNAPGCSWSALSNESWIHVTAGASGSDNGSVTLGIDANNDGARSGIVAIGPPVIVAQDAATPTRTCGSAVDITEKVSIYRSGFTPVDFFGLLERQAVVVTNKSGTTLVGPFFLVFVGLPTAHIGVVGTPSLTTCFSTQGDTVGLLNAVVLPPGGTMGYLPLFGRTYWWEPIQYVPQVVSGVPPLK